MEDKNVYNSPEIFFCSSVLLSLLFRIPLLSFEFAGNRGIVPFVGKSVIIYNYSLEKVSQLHLFRALVILYLHCH